jgi:hypothetical protein
VHVWVAPFETSGLVCSFVVVFATLVILIFVSKKQKNVEGSIFSQTSNLCSPKNLGRTWKCSTYHIVIAIDNESWGGCSTTFIDDIR